MVHKVIDGEWEYTSRKSVQSRTEYGGVGGGNELLNGEDGGEEE